MPRQAALLHLPTRRQQRVCFESQKHQQRQLRVHAYSGASCWKCAGSIVAGAEQQAVIALLHVNHGCCVRSLLVTYSCGYQGLDAVADRWWLSTPRSRGAKHGDPLLPAVMRDLPYN